MFRATARMERFEELGSFRHNHTTAGVFDVGFQVLNAIRFKERYFVAR